MSAPDQQAVKRAYFRLDVTLPMAYRFLTDEEASIPLPAIPDTAFIEHHFKTKLTDIDQKIEHLIDTISSQHKLLGSIFKALNDKMNILAPALNEKSVRNIVSSIPINLSAGGLSFATFESIRHGQMVDLLLALDHAADPVVIRSQLVKIIPQGDNSNYIALEFQNVTEEARRQLVYYIQTQELAMARQKRGG
jgi:hypothetical protein